MTELAPESTETPEGAQNSPEGSEKTFPAAYVATLRKEAADNRVKAAEALEQITALREALQVAYLRQASAGVLHEPIAWSDEFDGEDGLPDINKIADAVQALAADKPWLGRPQGDIGGGYRGEATGESVDLAALLFASA